MTQAYPLPSAESRLDGIALPRLKGGWLRLARGAWVVLPLVAVGALAASLPGYAPRFAGQLAHLALENPGAGIRLIAGTSALVSLASTLLSMGLALILYLNRFEAPAANVLLSTC